MVVRLRYVVYAAPCMLDATQSHLFLVQNHCRPRPPALELLAAPWRRASRSAAWRRRRCLFHLPHLLIRRNLGLVCGSDLVVCPTLLTWLAVASRRPVWQAKLSANAEFYESLESVDGLVIGGSTGEFASLSVQERASTIETVGMTLPHTAKQLIAGTGCNSVADTLLLTQRAAVFGFHAVMVLPPHYYKRWMTCVMWACGTVPLLILLM